MPSLRILLILAACAFLTATADMAPPPPRGHDLPEDWEKNVTPGFDPSIESVIVDYGQFTAEQRHGIISKWGAGKAIPVLVGLHDNPQWAAYAGQIRSLLAESGSEEAWQWLTQRLAESAAKAHEDKKAATTANGIVYVLTRFPGERARPVLSEHVQDTNSAVQLTAAYTLCNAYPDKDSLELFRQAAAKTTGERARRQLEGLADQLAGQLRAKEPLKDVGPNEKGKSQ